MDSTKIHDQSYDKKLERTYKNHRNLATECSKIANSEFYRETFETTSFYPNKNGSLLA